MLSKLAGAPLAARGKKGQNEEATQRYTSPNSSFQTASLLL